MTYKTIIFFTVLAINWASPPPSRLLHLPQTNAPLAEYKVISSYPHDPSSFTQGLYFDEGFLFESTGRYGKSKLFKNNLSGKTIAFTKLPHHLWGEGITIVNNNLIQLTWKAGIGFVRNKQDPTFKTIKTFLYKGEGWGLTYDGKWLIMSNGSNILSFLHPDTFRVNHQIFVQDNTQAITMLNELEYIEGEIWANIWKSNNIVTICPKTGQVTSRIDLSSLAQKVSPHGHGNVLNGIAYDTENKRIFITGKLWPNIYEIALANQ